MTLESINGTFKTWSTLSNLKPEHQWKHTAYTLCGCNIDLQHDIHGYRERKVFILENNQTWTKSFPQKQTTELYVLVLPPPPLYQMWICNTLLLHTHSIENRFSVCYLTLTVLWILLKLQAVIINHWILITQREICSKIRHLLWQKGVICYF